MFKSRLKIFRRASSIVTDQPSSPPNNKNHDDNPSPNLAPSPSPSPAHSRQPKQSRSFSSLRDRRRKALLKEKKEEDQQRQKSERTTKDHDAPPQTFAINDPILRSHSIISGEGTTNSTLESGFLSERSSAHSPAEAPPEVIVEEPTPGSPPKEHPLTIQPLPSDSSEGLLASTARTQSLASGQDVDSIKALLHGDPKIASSTPEPALLQRSFTEATETTALNTIMMSRKIWVKRPNASATMVLIREDDMVDEAKESILRKYANSLGRHYDAPDVTIRIMTRAQPGERVLNPDESMCRTIDSYYPGGQTVDEALVIDIPPRRTPRPSPRATHNHSHAQPHQSYHYQEQESSRPHESGTDYFPIMPPINLGQASPLLTNASHESHSHESRKSHAAHERAMSVLSTGQVPPLPSPGAGRRAHIPKQHRPHGQRTQTASPTTLASAVASRANRPRLDSVASNDRVQSAPAVAPALPTPPVAESKGAPAQPPTNPPTPRVSSPRPAKARRTKAKQKEDTPSLPPGILDTSVPPINVLIVEDNMINMRLLEQFVRRLGVRWHTAVNGREAVTKWRQGGFHLVLMDIQLPIMSGLEATKEIRRLERVNNIGVFSSASDIAPELTEVVISEEDRLDDEGNRLFKSPVIIVALTASNLQSDRHEALAAGCNDFLTKPVNFVWFERKVKEWGCMQALIDFDGWRKWKDFAEANGLKDASDTKGPNKFSNKGGKGNTRVVKAKGPPDPDTLKPEVMETRGKEISGENSPTTVKGAVGAEARDFAGDGGKDGEQGKKDDSPDTVVDHSMERATAAVA